MSCAFHRWLLSSAADARRAAPRATQRHCAACAACRAYADLCARLPHGLAAGAPAVAEGFDTFLLQHRILARTALVPKPLWNWKRYVSRFPVLGEVMEFFAHPWRPALASLSLACLLFAADEFIRQQAERTQQRQTTFAALQAVQLAYDHALQQGPAVVAGLLDTAAQHIAADAAAAVDFLGAALPPVAQPNRS